MALDPQDKVLGTLSVFVALGMELPPLDYSMSVQELYIAATRIWLMHCRSLQPIYLAVTGRKTEGLPSWAIDWNFLPEDDHAMFRSYWHLARHYGSHQPRAHVHELSHQSQASRGFSQPHLHVHGILGDTVADLAFARPEGDESGNMANRLAGFLLFILAASGPATFVATGVQQLVDIISEDLRRVWDIDKDTAERIILHKASRIDPSIASEASHWSKHWNVRESIRSYDDDCRKEKFRSEDIRHVAAELEERCRVQAPFLSAAGRVGFCFCESLQEGDAIALLARSDFPVVLRPTSEPGRYTSMDPATVYGMMHGEFWSENLEELNEILLI